MNYPLAIFPMCVRHCRASELKVYIWTKSRSSIFAVPWKQCTARFHSSQNANRNFTLPVWLIRELKHFHLLSIELIVFWINLENKDNASPNWHAFAKRYFRYRANFPNAEFYSSPGASRWLCGERRCAYYARRQIGNSGFAFAFKRKVNGIVRRSATGKTVFIEPTGSGSQQSCAELEGEERRKLYVFWVEFTNLFGHILNPLWLHWVFLGEIDFLRAKALLPSKLKPSNLVSTIAASWNGPKQFTLFYISRWKKRRKKLSHWTLRWMKSKGYWLFPGGCQCRWKIGVFKTVVLLQYMMQCGLLIPVHDSSRAGIFERLFIDIGDEQSIENDLSTL